jgi:hypothetical protein
MRWYIYRCGRNAANQPTTFSARVAEVIADTEHEAFNLAHRSVTVYDNQHLEIKNADKVDREEAEITKRARLL